jgi:hypothetical protein
LPPHQKIFGSAAPTSHFEEGEGNDKDVSGLSFQGNLSFSREDDEGYQHLVVP